MVSTKGTVLTTGSTGFVGAHVVDQLLKAGYKVRAAIRKPNPALEAEFPSVEFIIVPDLTKSGAYKGHLAGIDAIVHVASPLAVFYEDYQKDLIQPAIQATKVILEAAAATPSVKRVVITSSTVINLDWADYAKDPKHVVTEKDLLKVDPTKNDYGEDAFGAYVASKVLADEATWKFVEENKPSFDVVTINPTFIFGKPFLDNKTPDGTNYMLVSAVKPGMDSWGPASFGAAVHVVDVAVAHVRALDPSVKGNQRFIVHSAGHSWAHLPELAKKIFPKGNWKDENGIKDIPAYIDGSKAERELGIKYKPFDDIFRETIDYYVN